MPWLYVHILKDNVYLSILSIFIPAFIPREMLIEVKDSCSAMQCFSVSPHQISIQISGQSCQNLDTGYSLAENDPVCFILASDWSREPRPVLPKVNCIRLWKSHPHPLMNEFNCRDVFHLLWWMFVTFPPSPDFLPPSILKMFIVDSFVALFWSVVNTIIMCNT